MPPGQQPQRPEKPSAGVRASSRKTGLLPAGKRSDTHQEQRRDHQRREDGIEVGRADRQLAGAECVDEQRIECAEQDRRASDDQ